MWKDVLVVGRLFRLVPDGKFYFDQFLYKCPPCILFMERLSVHCFGWKLWAVGFKDNMDE